MPVRKPANARSCLCYIEVIANPRIGAPNLTYYGPYANEAKAEDNLRERGWKKHGWLVWEAMIDGCYMAATIKLIPCSPRNRLPHSKK